MQVLASWVVEICRFSVLSAMAYKTGLGYHPTRDDRRWLFGLVANNNSVVHINGVALRRARLVQGWVTVSVFNISA